MKTNFSIYLISLFVLLSAFTCEEIEPVSFEPSCLLSEELQEISGIVPYGEHFLAISDSGSKNAVYELNDQCEVVQEYVIEGATNIDWEAIAIDDSILYIGNFGNNFGNRKDLEIIKVRVEDLAPSTPLLQKIAFTYEDQVDFDNADTHNFDCEAMVANGAEILLFTKNRGNSLCHVYKLNSIESEQVARRKNELNIRQLVTDAYYYKEIDQILFTAYTFDTVSDIFRNVVYTVQYENGIFQNNLIAYPHLDNFQIESICVNGPNIFTASEGELDREPELFVVDYASYIMN